MKNEMVEKMIGHIVHGVPVSKYQGRNALELVRLSDEVHKDHRTFDQII